MLRPFCTEPEFNPLTHLFDQDYSRDVEFAREAPMEQIVTATFEDGVLKPDVPIALPPRTRVRLTLQPLPSPGPTDELSWDNLEKLWDEVTIDSAGVRPTRDQLHERR